MVTLRGCIRNKDFLSFGWTRLYIFHHALLLSVSRILKTLVSLFKSSLTALCRFLPFIFSIFFMKWIDQTTYFYLSKQQKALSFTSSAKQSMPPVQLFGFCHIWWSSFIKQTFFQSRLQIQSNFMAVYSGY